MHAAHVLPGTDRALALVGFRRSTLDADADHIECTRTAKEFPRSFNNAHPQRCRMADASKRMRMRRSTKNDTSLLPCNCREITKKAGKKNLLIR